MTGTNSNFQLVFLMAGDPYDPSFFTMGDLVGRNLCKHYRTDSNILVGRTLSFAFARSAFLVMPDCHRLYQYHSTRSDWCLLIVMQLIFCFDASCLTLPNFAFRSSHSLVRYQNATVIAVPPVTLYMWNRLADLHRFHHPIYSTCHVLKTTPFPIHSDHIKQAKRCLSFFCITSIFWVAGHSSLPSPVKCTLLL